MFGSQDALPLTPDWLSQSGCIQRGWTRRLVTRFLGTPDRTVPNSHVMSGPPIKLYRGERVARIETTPEFHTAAALADRRRVGSRKGAAVTRERERHRRELDALARRAGFRIIDGRRSPRTFAPAGPNAA